MHDEIMEAVKSKIQEYNIDEKFAPLFYKLAMTKNDDLRKIAELETGERNVE